MIPKAPSVSLDKRLGAARGTLGQVRLMSSGLVLLGFVWALTGAAVAHATEGLVAQQPKALPSLAPLHTPDADRLAQALAALRGKPLVLHFWGTWCEPCRDEIPALGRYAAAHPDAPAIVTVAVADRRDKIDSFLADAGAQVTVLEDREQTLIHAFGIHVLPATLVLDAAHRIRYRGIGALDWDADATRETVARVLAHEHAAAVPATH